MIFFLENQHLPLSEQTVKAGKLDVNRVVFQDLDNLKSYLKGEIDTCDQIDASKQFSGGLVSDSGAMDIEESQEEPIMSEDLMEEHRSKFSSWLATRRKSPFLLAHMPAESVTYEEDPKRKYCKLDPEYWKADQRKVQLVKKSASATQTKDSILRKHGNDGQPKSFKFALDLFNEHVLRFLGKDGKLREQEMRRNGASSSSKNKPKMSIRGPPIIVVPNSLTGCISSYNAMDFLSNDAKWISIADKKKSGGKREKEVKITHDFPNGSTVEFLVMDDPRTLRTEQDWERIVAVFAIGEPWQFKEWRYSNPVELFQNVCGIHLMLDNDKASQNIKSWSCKVLKINQFKRHLDVGAANDFWDMLHAFCSKKKTWMYKAPSTSFAR